MTANPYDVINNSNLKGVIETNIPLLNTYVSCLSKDIRDNLGVKPFIKSLWNNDDSVVFKLKSKTKKRKVSIDDDVDNILKALCEYFVDRSARIKGVDLSNDTFLKIFDLPIAALNLSRLQHFKFGIQYNCDAVSSAAKIAKNIERLDIDLRDAPFPTMITSLSDIANSCLQVLELSANSDFDRFENVCLKFCPNIKKFVTTKISSYDHIISMVTACKRLEEIYIYEDRNEEMFSWHLTCDSTDANNS
ncbi:13951_t:CDS:2 [Funneliformis mosseae]|uniref:13951_t:CDS:1 n=1 Tax=Funneliformis mosseae TaxID=27381 RepID=A0A9N8YTR9_FUNMO|nr:13951_t:CDS:2 [Funneliformis mosseae]